MKVLILSSNVEQSNSVGKIATELNSFLNKKNIQAKVVYLGGNYDLPYTVRLQPRLISSLHYRFTQITEYLFVRTPFLIHKLRKEIEQFKPDIIHLVQPLIRFIDNEQLFSMIGELDLPCVYSMIDENPYLGNCDNAYDCNQFMTSCELCNGKNRTINKSINKCWCWSKAGSSRVAKNKRKGYENIKNICFIAPEWVIKRASESALLKNKQFFVVDEYVNNIDVYYPRVINNKLLLKFNIDLNKIIITNVAKYSNPRKGVDYFIKLARLMENDERFLFISIGFDGKKEIVPSNLVCIPFVSNQNELAEFYSIADLAMITSISDTMPNTSLEALSCGTPFCCFNITGIPYVAREPLGIFVEPKNVNALKSVVEKTSKKTVELSKKCREYALSRYSPEVITNKIVRIYNIMINK